MDHCIITERQRKSTTHTTVLTDCKIQAVRPWVPMFGNKHWAYDCQPVWIVFLKVGIYWWNWGTTKETPACLHLQYIILSQCWLYTADNIDPIFAPIQWHIIEIHAHGKCLRLPLWLHRSYPTPVVPSVVQQLYNSVVTFFKKKSARWSSPVMLTNLHCGYEYEWVCSGAGGGLQSQNEYTCELDWPPVALTNNKVCLLNRKLLSSGNKRLQKWMGRSNAGGNATLNTHWIDVKSSQTSQTHSIVLSYKSSSCSSYEFTQLSLERVRKIFFKCPFVFKRFMLW